MRQEPRLFKTTGWWRPDDLTDRRRGEVPTSYCPAVGDKIADRQGYYAPAAGASCPLVHLGGWQLGVGPSIVVMDQGMARSFTTATQLQGVYAFIFDQQGLMAGMGLQGSKITPYTPDY